MTDRKRRLGELPSTILRSPMEVDGLNVAHVHKAEIDSLPKQRHQVNV